MQHTQHTSILVQVGGRERARKSENRIGVWKNKFHNEMMKKKDQRFRQKAQSLCGNGKPLRFLLAKSTLAWPSSHRAASTLSACVLSSIIREIFIKKKKFSD